MKLMSNGLNLWLKARGFDRDLTKPFAYEILDALWTELSVGIDTLREDRLKMTDMLENSAESIAQLELEVLPFP